jgi:hypothetical protein
MTWKDNDQIYEQELLDALTVASRDEKSGIWSRCSYNDHTFHGVIGINEKDFNARIVVAYVLKYLNVFRVAIGFRPFYQRNVIVNKTDYITYVS